MGEGEKMSERFMENKDGVHLLHPHGGYAMCGDALDIGSEAEEENMRVTEKTTVSCIRCVEIIDACRYVYCRRP